MTHAELIKRGAKWLKNNSKSEYRFPIVLKEFKSFALEIPDIIGFNNCRTIVIECKISLQDFNTDQRKIHRKLGQLGQSQLGDRRFYLCPVGLIPVDKIPKGWGLLYAHEHKITVEAEAPIHESTRVEEYHILYSIARRALIKGFMPEILKPIPQDKIVRKHEYYGGKISE